MGIINNIQNMLSKSKEVALSSFISGLGSDQDVQNRLPITPDWFLNPVFGQPRGLNFYELRQYAASPWVQMVIQTIKKEITNIPIDIVNVDEEDDTKYEKETTLIMNFFDKINSNDEELMDMIAAAVDDVAKLDSGVWVKVFTEESYELTQAEIINELGEKTGVDEVTVLKPFGQRELKEIWYADGGTFTKQVDPYRRLQAYFQYSYKKPMQKPKQFFPAEIVWMQLNKRTDSIYGMSPLQSAQQIVELMIQSTRWNKDYFKNNAIPDGIIGLVNSNPESFASFKKNWKKEVQGKPHRLLFHNTDVNFQALTGQAKDMEWLDGQKWFMHMIFAVYGVSPVEAGFHENVNQGNTSGQERVTVRNAIKPYLTLFERMINRQILPELLQDERPKVKFKFLPEDHDQEKILFENSMKEIEVGTLTVNEYRRMRGRDAVEGGDVSRNSTTQNEDDEFDNSFGGSDNSSNSSSTTADTDGDSKPKKQQGGKEDKPQKKVLIKSKDNPYPEAESYETFLSHKFNDWETKVIQALSEVNLTKSGSINQLTYKNLHQKSFSDFVNKLLQGVTSQGFLKGITKVVKQSMHIGLSEAEDELNIDIGSGVMFDNQVQALSNQQLTGYMINGNQWHGIKGVADDIRNDVLKLVEDNVRNKVTLSDTTKEIQQLFKGVESTQARRIARTETTRFLNEGKLSGFKDSGIKGLKTYKAVGDSHTSEQCKRLDAKYRHAGIGYEDVFSDDKTGQQFEYPPTHVNCRCRIGFQRLK